MPEVQLDGIRACVFDAYGTIFDYASAATNCRDHLGDKLDRLTTLWRDKQLQYTWLRTLANQHVDFWQVTGDALDFALDTLGIENATLRDRLMSLYLTLEPFPEVRETLQRLKAAGVKTAVCLMDHRACSVPLSTTQRSARLSTWYCRLKRSVSIRRIRRSINLLSTA
jgi:2-haloacid dehalogenase